MTENHQNNALDYYPFGWKLPGRQMTGGQGYRYGYQGQFSEEDKETGWNQFEARMYDSRVGRWLSTDPARQHPSPYMAMGNNPAMSVDPDGRRCVDADGNPISCPEGYEHINDISDDYHFYKDEGEVYAFAHYNGEKWSTDYIDSGTNGQMNNIEGAGSKSNAKDILRSTSLSMAATAKQANNFTDITEASAKQLQNLQLQTQSRELTKQALNSRSLHGAAKTIGKTAGIAGIGYSIYQGAEDGNWTYCDTARTTISTLVVIGGPVGWTYGVIDLGVGVFTKQSLTERLVNQIDNHHNVQ